MAELTKKKTKAKKKSRSKKQLSRTGSQWKEALDLESKLEVKLLADAILSAKLAVSELEEETRKAPFERRSGLRLKEKAIKTERAFNRLRALRLGELLPERCSDDY